MLFLTAALLTEYTMPALCLFNKGQHIAALEISHAKKSAQLIGYGRE